MAESPDSAFLRGAISKKAASKHLPGILKQTRVNRPNEEKFDGKQGRGDQGGADWSKPFDTGDLSVAGTGHIDTKQSKGSPARASGAPSRGGGAGSENQPVRRNNIDDPATNKPDWPKGSKVKGKAKWKTPKKAAGGGGNPSNKNQYGDPPSGRKYG